MDVLHDRCAGLDIKGVLDVRDVGPVDLNGVCSTWSTAPSTSPVRSRRAPGSSSSSATSTRSCSGAPSTRFS